MPTDLPALIARLEAASEGSRAFWCVKCGYVSLSDIRISPARSEPCHGKLQHGTPAECIRALQAMSEGG